MNVKPNSLRTGPDEHGHFGIYGGRFVAETLMPLVLELERAYTEAKNDPAFKAEMDYFLKHYVGRPSPLYFAERLTGHLRGAKIYLKRDELNHTGAHKINNVHGADPAGAPHGQEAHHRRDRRRPARRRHRHGLRALRARVRRLHGRHRHRTAEAERLPHEIAWRRSAPGDLGLQDAERRHERGVA